MSLVHTFLFLSILAALLAVISASSCHHPQHHWKGLVTIDIIGWPKMYIPSTTYTVKVHSGDAFTKFRLTVEGKRGGGSLQVADGGGTAFAEHCINTLVEDSDREKTSVTAYWMAPSTTGCANLRVSVKMSDGWYQTNKTICALDEKIEEQKHIKCCACDHAKYKMVFEGIWSPQTHPKDFPTSLWLTHFSDVVGATHSPDFTLWAEGKLSSYGFKQLAEFGVVRELETELRNSSIQLRSLVKAAGLWHPNLNGNTTAVFRVDPRRHLLSLASMFGPSPDWIVGVSSLDLCKSDCSWEENMKINLLPYDAGTDSGISYMSVNSPSEPQERIMKITTSYPEDERAPFYNRNGGEIPPLATLYITREKIIPKLCSDLTELELQEQVTFTENTEEDVREECAVSEYSEWTPCSVTCGKGLRMRTRKYLRPNDAAQFKCDRQLVSKEMCVSSEPTCPGEEDELEIEKLSEGSECDVTAWSDWSDCSVTCGIGFIIRSRSFMNDTPPVHKKCMHINTMEKEKCMLPTCKPTNNWIIPECRISEWSEWSPCSVTCDKGIRTRIRTLSDSVKTSPACQRINLKESHTCSFPSCQAVISPSVCKLEPHEGPCRGGFTRWAFVESEGKCIPFNYGGCRGNKNNFNTERECMTFCGINQNGDGILDSSQKPVDCVVSKWGQWSPCKPCPVGYRTRNRTILVQPENGGSPCPITKKAIKCTMPSEFCIT